MTPPRANPSLLGRAAALPLHPFLFVALGPLAVYDAHPGEMFPADYWLSTGFLVGATLLLWLAARLLVRGVRAAALLTTVFLAFFFGYARLFGWMERWWRGSYEALHAVLVAAGVLLLATLALRLRRHRPPLAAVTLLLNVVALGTLLLPAARVAWFQVRFAADVTTAELEAMFPAPAAARRPQPLPDIYYIVLDRYAGADTLAADYGYDNRTFLAALEARGFFVARDALANYPKTPSSLAASLNLGYLDPLVARVGREARDARPRLELVRTHAVGRFLRQQGYRFVQFGSWWAPTRTNPHADEMINRFWLPTELRQMVYFTPLHPLARRWEIAALDFRRLQWEQTRFQFAELEKIPARAEATFVFAHFLVPHDPYVFESDGSFVADTVESARSFEEGYRRQVEFTNRNLLRLVDRLLADSEAPPIILLQADEGPFPPRYRRAERTFSWREATDAELRHKFSIFSAYYLPGGAGERLYPGITPVNSFRVVLGHYFGTELPLLEDRVFAHENLLQPYTFFEVTHRLHAP